MKNRKLLLIVSLVLALTMSLGGTLAYLTDTDADVNVMTVGNVNIVQNEQQRGENGLEQFDTAAEHAMYPVTKNPNSGYDQTYDADWNVVDKNSGDVEYSMFDTKYNFVDKIVSVTNTGNTEAYVRTIFAFEMKKDGDKWVNPIGSDVKYCINNRDIVWVTDDAGNKVEIEIGDVKYIVGQYYYDNDSKLASGETTPASLTQVYLMSHVDNEWYEQVGETYEIRVLSQAVQAAGFADAATALDEAFGVLNVANATEWFAGATAGSPGEENDTNNPPNYIESADEAYDSSRESGVFTLAGDINTSDSDDHYNSNREYAIRDGNEYTLNLNGHTINHDGTYQDGNSTGYTYLYTAAYNGKLTINGEGTIESANSEGFACIVYAQGPSEVVINGGDFNVDKGIAVWAGKDSKVTINGGSFISTGSDDQELIYSSGGIIDIYGGFFHNTLQDNRPVNVANRNRDTGFINIYGGTFVNFDPSTGGDDPNNILVADGYKVVSETQANGDIWYTVVADN